MKVTAIVSSAVMLLSLSAVLQAQPPGGYSPHRSYGPASTSNSFSVQRGMRFERTRDENGYVLRIHTRGLTPDAVQVSVRGHTLMVQNQESRQVEQRSDRGSYQFSSASSSMRRRFPIPPDADAKAMQRTVEDGVIVITLPYTKERRY
ncbi:MAG: Hsp20/alpha crystallin family protein [Candidatus Thiodiazotropha sp. (ex Myrtea spinifera)]|nr:Hsp20/alpha crystallin family protein [Candidatus Thiodiazotropha sp. (ex Myrtea spinifera)]